MHSATGSCARAAAGSAAAVMPLPAPCAPSLSKCLRSSQASCYPVHPDDLLQFVKPQQLS